jgi:hypothetical protein
MRTFDADILAELSKEVLTCFFMLELQFATTMRINDSEVDVYDGSGNKFSSVSFSFGDISGSAGLAVESIDIEIDDTNQIVTAALLSADVRNKVAILYFGVVTSANVIKTQELIRGFVGEWELYDDNKAKVTIVNELVLWNKKCLRMQSPSCPWTFKGTECAYPGTETWCDQSWNRCDTLGNSVNFGGHRFLPSVMEKEIWWGRVPK